MDTRAWEESFNYSGEVLGFFSEQVASEFLDLIKVGDKETAIMELEMVAMVVALDVWKQKLSSH